MVLSCYVYTVLNKKEQYLKVYKRFLLLKFGKTLSKISLWKMPIPLKRNVTLSESNIVYIQFLFKIKLFLLKMHCKLLFENTL